MAVPVIGVEGLLGIGKTTLCREIAKRVGGLVIEEPVDANPFLAKFYEELRLSPQGYIPVNTAKRLLETVQDTVKDLPQADRFHFFMQEAIRIVTEKKTSLPSRYPWHLPFVMQIFLLHYRYASKQSAMHSALTRNPPQGPVFLDRTIWGDLNFENLLFKSGHISKEQHMCYRFCFDVMSSSLRFPTHVIYLYTSPETAYRRMKDRNRDVEVGVEMSYLKALHDEYEKMYNDMLTGRIIGARGATMERVNYNADFDVDNGVAWDQLAEMVQVMVQEAKRHA